MHTTVLVRASAGAMRWKQTCVSGNPCSRTTGGPLPPRRAKMRPACVSSQCEAKPGKRSSDMDPPQRGSGPPRGHDIRPGEVVTLEEKRVATRLRERVREAIADVEAGRVPPFAEREKGAYRQVHLLDRNGHGLDVQGVEMLGDLRRIGSD